MVKYYGDVCYCPYVHFNVYLNEFRNCKPQSSLWCALGGFQLTTYFWHFIGTCDSFSEVDDFGSRPLVGASADIMGDIGAISDLVKGMCSSVGVQPHLSGPSHPPGSAAAATPSGAIERNQTVHTILRCC